MAKPPGKCIFCGGPGLSKEHVIAEWVQQVVPADEPYSTHTLIRASHNKTPFPASYRPKQQGDFLKRKLYRVCADCNGGWMSRLQERTKPFLGPMFLGDWSSLTVEGQGLVCAWIAMAIMVFEWADPSTVAISGDERRAFMENKRPSPHWWITGAKLQEPRKTIWHAGMAIDSGQPTDPLPIDCNTQLTMGAIGRFMFGAFSSDEAFFTVPPDAAFRLGITPLWPIRNVAARPIRSLSSEEADRVIIALRGSFPLPRAQF